MSAAEGGEEDGGADGEDGDRGPCVARGERGCGGAVPAPDALPRVPASATRSVTYAPNRSSAPAAGSDAATRAPSGGGPAPAWATAGPRSASRRLASPNVVPVRDGTALRSRVSNTESSSPVVPVGRSMPRAASSTSTSAIRSSSRGAGRTTTTSERS